MGVVQTMKDWFAPVVMSRIVDGALYHIAAVDMYKKGLLVSPPLDLAPAHANCARVIFMNTQNAVLDLELLAHQNACSLVFDSIVFYGLNGTPFTD